MPKLKCSTCCDCVVICTTHFVHSSLSSCTIRANVFLLFCSKYPLWFLLSTSLLGQRRLVCLKCLTASSPDFLVRCIVHLLSVRPSMCTPTYKAGAIFRLANKNRSFTKDKKRNKRFLAEGPSPNYILP